MMDWMTTPPEGVPETLGLLAALDACLRLGFSRLGPDQAEALARLARTFAGTPLGDPVREGVEALLRAEFREEHFVTIAAARASLNGAVHDALLERALEALAWTAAPAEASPATGLTPQVETWMASTRAWLLELAISGFAQLTPQAVLPFLATLEELQGEPQAARLSMLLTGLVHELLDVMPLGTSSEVPSRRWADLWTRAMLGATGLPSAPTGREVSGTLCLIGAELHHHTHAVSAVFHGVLEAPEPTLVTVTASAYKVDAVTGSELWRCFGDTWTPLLTAFHKTKSLTLSGMTLLSTGALLWDADKATLGAKSSPLDTASEVLGDAIEVPRPAPEDRHPVQLALPVYLKGYTVTEDALEVGGTSIPVDMVRVEPDSELADGLGGTKRCVGLLRFDAGAWRVTPLVATKSKKLLWSVPGEAGGSDTVSVLRERAGKLLRRKS